MDKLIGSDGYPDRSAILVIGPPGIGKEALGYRFAYSGLQQGEFCLSLASFVLALVLGVPPISYFIGILFAYFWYRMARSLVPVNKLYPNASLENKRSLE